MEVSHLTTFELLLLTLIFIILAKLVSILYTQFTYWKRNKVPYIRSSPLFGTAWRVFFRLVSFPNYCKYIYNYYPDARYVGVMDFATPTVIVRDPKLIKEIAVKNFNNFPDHRSFVTEEMDPVFGKNVFSLKGDRWREMRNTLSPSFTANKMRFMFDLVSKCSHDFVSCLHDRLESSSSEIEGKNLFTRYSNDVIATVAFGISVNSIEHPDNEFYRRGIDVSTFSGTFRFIKFMLFRLNPRLTRMAGFTFLSRATSKFFWRVISETVTARKRRGIVRPDMIHLLMQATDSKKKSIHQTMTIDDIVAQAFIFFLAGFDTTSTLMCYVVHELALHQDVQRRLREEVDRVLDDGTEISYEDTLGMEYLEMVISETLRMHPPTLLIDRQCAKEFHLPPAGPGYESVTIHPGENIWFPVLAIHRDPAHFPDPDKFDPERFNRENRNGIDPYTYIPFGVGPRKCIGNRFALMETKLLIIRLLRKFVIKPCERTMDPIVYKKGNFTLMPKDGFWVTFEKRNDH